MFQRVSNDQLTQKWLLKSSWIRFVTVTRTIKNKQTNKHSFPILTKQTLFLGFNKCVEGDKNWWKVNERAREGTEESIECKERRSGMWNKPPSNMCTWMCSPLMNRTVVGTCFELILIKLGNSWLKLGYYWVRLC